jgi:hypothetical protein
MVYTHSLKETVMNFLNSSPTPEEIVAFRLPDALRTRARFLLKKHREGVLSAQEQREMDEFWQTEHLLTLLKTKARLKLSASV